MRAKLIHGDFSRHGHHTRRPNRCRYGLSDFLASPHFINGNRSPERNWSHCLKRNQDSYADGLRPASSRRESTLVATLGSAVGVRQPFLMRELVSRDQPVGERRSSAVVASGAYGVFVALGVF